MPSDCPFGFLLRTLATLTTVIFSPCSCNLETASITAFRTSVFVRLPDSVNCCPCRSIFRIAFHLVSPKINPKMDYLFGQDRMVAGSVTAGGFGFTAVVRGEDLTVGGRALVTAGKL